MSQDSKTFRKLSEFFFKICPIHSKCVHCMKACWWEAFFARGWLLATPKILLNLDVVILILISNAVLEEGGFLSTCYWITWQDYIVSAVQLFILAAIFSCYIFTIINIGIIQNRSSSRQIKSGPNQFFI